MVTKRKDAEVFIVLSGSATVQRGGNGGSQTFGPGQCFGSLDYFDSIHEFEGDFDRDDDHEHPLGSNSGGGADEVETDPKSVDPDAYNSSSLEEANGKKNTTQRRGSGWGGISTAKFEKGSYMRMSLHDFYKYVLKPESFALDPEIMKADSAIAGG
eukprot:gene38030-46930_t